MSEEIQLQSEDVSKIVPKLAELQKQVLVVVKKQVATNKGEKMYHFADLMDVWEVIREKIGETGFYIRQTVGRVVEINGRPYAQLVTWAHLEDQWIRDNGHYPIPEGTRMMNAAQAFGSAITYARRYGLCCLLGIVSGDDDDAQRAFASVGRTQGPNLTDRPAMTWQAIYDAGTWRTEPNAEDGGATTLGDMGTGELRAMIAANSKSADPVAGIVAASAEMLMRACEKRGQTLKDALAAVNWKGVTALHELTPRDILLAFNAITAPVAPKQEAPSE